MFARLIEQLRVISRRQALDRRGAVAVTFGLAALTILLAVGSGIDLGRAYLARQQLSAVATLTCQYANRPSIVQLAFGNAANGGGATGYAAKVNAYAALAFASQNVTWSLSTATPFSYAQGGAGNVSVGASIPTALMYLIGVTTMPVSASVQCFTSPASGSQPVADSTSKLLVKEGFENNAYPKSLTWYTPSGGTEPYASGAFVNNPVNTPPATIGYVGVNGTEWLLMGYCLEVDVVGQILNTVPEGSNSAELDCDDGSGNAGNSSISTLVYLAAGAYELRWDYAARLPDYYYGSSYICGSAASDTAWANDTGYYGVSTALGTRTNQINVYLDQNSTGAPPPHTTLDGRQQLGGSNMIDQCVYSSGWIYRTVPITVTSAGYYWLSFAADGGSDSFGGQIDDIRLCVGSCAGSVPDDFPPGWLTNNGGLLFEDSFESPTYSGQYYNNSGNIGVSQGSSSVWNEKGKGWADAPTNQIPYWTTGCPQGNQCIQLGGGTASSNAINTLVARPFLLDPGYYRISYNYVSEAVFATTGAYCGTTPSAAGLPTSNVSSSTYRQIPGSGPGNLVHDTNAVGVFMSHAQMASTPNPSTAFQSTTSYTNPDGTITTTPAMPPNAINLSNYTPSSTSPLLDICGYATSSQSRTRDVRVLKPAFYWLTFAALGTADGIGGEIDDVRVTALGSPTMTSPPANPVTIPVPAPQPGSTLSFPGFSIITGGQY